MIKSISSFDFLHVRIKCVSFREIDLVAEEIQDVERLK